ncbi:MAG: hypothetical protein K0R22_2057, partial [Sporomusa sp.]|nr:hypothetical protein [Sporomusa sp.]
GESTSYYAYSFSCSILAIGEWTFLSEYMIYSTVCLNKSFLYAKFIHLGKVQLYPGYLTGVILFDLKK